MKPSILFRCSDKQEEQEFLIAQKYFPVYESRAEIKDCPLVIGRYSVLPYYRELEIDLSLGNSNLINSYRQHLYLADLMAWYDDLAEFTPETWSRLEDVPDNVGPLVLKGQTNSKKFLWDTHMFAKDKRDASRVLCNLQDDSLIGSQNIYARAYYPLKQYGVGLHGLPITEEYRFFVCAGEILCGAFYWSQTVDDLPEKPDPKRVSESFLKAVISRIGNKAIFYGIDVAITTMGLPIVIELNDGQMMGLSENDPEELYKNLARVLK